MATFYSESVGPGTVKSYATDPDYTVLSMTSTSATYPGGLTTCRACVFIHGEVSDALANLPPPLRCTVHFFLGESGTGDMTEITNDFVMGPSDLSPAPPASMKPNFHYVGSQIVNLQWSSETIRVADIGQSPHVNRSVSGHAVLDYTCLKNVPVTSRYAAMAVVVLDHLLRDLSNEMHVYPSAHARFTGYAVV